jgi:hypothetical protein
MVDVPEEVRQPRWKAFFFSLCPSDRYVPDIKPGIYILTPRFSQFSYNQFWYITLILTPKKSKNRFFFVSSFMQPVDSLRTSGSLILNFLKNQNQWFFDSKCFFKPKPMFFDSEFFWEPEPADL